MITAGNVRKRKPSLVRFYLIQDWVANDWQFPSSVSNSTNNKVIIITFRIFFTIT